MIGKKENKEKCLQQNIRTAEAIIKVFERGIERQRRSGDPVMRATLLFDKLCLVLDILCAGLLSNEETKDYPKELNEKILKTSNMVTEELTFVLDWISNPTYSPDHPFGNNIMESSKKHFDLSSAKAD